MPDDAPEMSHTFETAPSGRAKCRGCGNPIAKGSVRFGERLPNPYGEGAMTLWFHPRCGTYMRPGPFLEAMGDDSAALEDGPELERLAQSGLSHRRLPRLNGAQRSPTGRARCRSCRELIPKDSWRFSLLYYDEGRFEPSGFIHARCSQEFFGTIDVMDRVRHFAQLSEADLEDLASELIVTNGDVETSD